MERGSARPRQRVALKAIPVSIVAPSERWPDWYVIDGLGLDVLRYVGQAPLVQYLRDGTAIVHRSHLPVLRQDFPDLKVDPDGRVTGAELPVAPSWWSPRPWQHRGPRFIRARRGTLLADAPRIGKTAQIVAAHEPETGPLVVIGPLAARDVWIDWFKARWPGESPAVVEGRTYDRNVLDRPLVFAHYDILPIWQSMGNKRIGTLVFDEPHVLSNPRSLRSGAAMILAPRAHRVVCATGTPLWNEPAGLFPMLTCLCPGAWGKWFDFASRYANGRRGPHGFVADGVSSTDEFQLRLEEVMLARTWDEVAPDLPPTERHVLTVPVSTAEAHQLDLSSEAVRQGATRTPIGELARLRRILGAKKGDIALASAGAHLARGENVVVWVWHKDVARTLARDLQLHSARPVATITGDDSIAVRVRELARWRALPQPSALVATIAVGQVAIDLSHARHAVFAELDFTPATIGQAEMRTFSPMRPMTVTYIAADHRVDHAIVAALRKKITNAGLLGVRASDTPIEMLGDAFGVREPSDLERLRLAILSSRREP